MRLPPAIRRFDDDVDLLEARPPAQLPLDLVARRIQHAGVTRATRRDRHGHRTAGDPLDGVDDFAHRRWTAVAEVKDVDGPPARSAPSAVMCADARSIT